MQSRLMILRKESGLYQKDVAKYLGITGEVYSHKERGIRQFTADEMFKISDLFNKTLDEIFLDRNSGKTEVE